MNNDVDDDDDGDGGGGGGDDDDDDDDDDGGDIRKYRGHTVVKMKTPYSFLFYKHFTALVHYVLTHHYHVLFKVITNVIIYSQKYLAFYTKPSIIFMSCPKRSFVFDAADNRRRKHNPVLAKMWKFVPMIELIMTASFEVSYETVIYLIYSLHIHIYEIPLIIEIWQNQ